MSSSGLLPVDPKKSISDVFDNLYEMKSCGILCDAVLRTTSGDEFQIHSPVIAACIPSLKSKFLEEGGKIVIIPDVTREQMESIVEYAYTGKTQPTKENVKTLLEAASRLNIIGMIQDCYSFLLSSLSVSNCLDIFLYAKKNLCRELETNVYRYILYHFEEIAKENTEFVEMLVSDLFRLLHDTNLNCRSEEKVWEAALRWIYHDLPNRQRYVPSLLSCVRSGLISDSYFDQYIRHHPLVMADELCEPIINTRDKFFKEIETYPIHPACGPRDKITPLLAHTRIPHDILIVMGGWTTGNPSNIIETYDVRDNMWLINENSDPAGPRAYHKLAVIGENIFVIGGFDGKTNFNTCRRYNYIRKEWADIAPMHHRRCYVNVALLNDIIYAMGGHDGHHRLSSAEKYDYKRNQWTLISSMHFKRSDAAATAFRGMIYIMGGFSGTEVLNSAEYYDPQADEWNLIAFMTSPRSGVSCVVYHDSIYVIGGFDGASRLRNGEVYSFSTNTWTPLSDAMKKTKSNFAIEVIDDEIYVIGGFDGTSTISDVECFNDTTRTWVTKASLSVCKSALAACVIRNIPNPLDYVHKNRRLRVIQERQLKIMKHQGMEWFMPSSLADEENNGMDIENNEISEDQWDVEDQW